MEKISAEKKREYNRRYYEKLKQNKEKYEQRKEEARSRYQNMNDEEKKQYYDHCYEYTKRKRMEKKEKNKIS